MKKVMLLIVFLCLGSVLFAQLMDVGIGFQYGFARVVDDGETLRNIYEPGLIGTVRLAPGPVGFFGRIGLLFPSKVIEGNLRLDHNSYNYILFANAALGATLKTPLGDHFAFIFDLGLSINDLFYGGSFTDTVDASWKIKVENMGATYRGGFIFNNVKMKDKYNDWAFGIFGNAAIRFKFTSSISLEFGVAASFDFLRYRSYKFVADFSNASANGSYNSSTVESAIESTFPKDKIDSSGLKVTLESDGNFNVFKQFTFIPSISIVVSF